MPILAVHIQYIYRDRAQITSLISLTSEFCVRNTSICTCYGVQLALLTSKQVDDTLLQGSKLY